MTRILTIALTVTLAACAGNTASIGDAFDTPPQTPPSASRTSKAPETQATPQSDTTPPPNDASTPPETDAGSDPPSELPEADASIPPPPPPPPPSEPTDCPEIHNEFCRLDVYPKVYNYGYPKTCVSKYIRYYCAEVTYLGTPMYCCR